MEQSTEMEIIRKIEEYKFECIGGPLDKCIDWEKLKEKVDLWVVCKEHTGHANVENNSDHQTDYVVSDHIRVEPTHRLYKAVFAAYGHAVDHNAKMSGKRAV